VKLEDDMQFTLTTKKSLHITFNTVLLCFFILATFVMYLIVDVLSTPREDSAAATDANRLESEADVEDGLEDSCRELKSPNRRSSQVEAKDDVGPASTQVVTFVSI